MENIQLQNNLQLFLIKAQSNANMYIFVTRIRNLKSK